jgi:hypothetical protein
MDKMTDGLTESSHSAFFSFTLTKESVATDFIPIPNQHESRRASGVKYVDKNLAYDAVQFNRKWAYQRFEGMHGSIPDKSVRLA